MILEREKSGIFINQYLNYGFKPLLNYIEICSKIGLLYNLINKLNQKNFDNCFDTLLILIDATKGEFEQNETNSKEHYLIFYNLLNDLRYNIKNIDLKKYLNELNKILNDYLKRLESSLKEDSILKSKIYTLELNEDSIYYQIFNNFKNIVLNFINNIINNKIDNKNKDNIVLISKVLMDIYNNLMHMFTILLPEKYDYKCLKELEMEFQEYLEVLNSFLEKFTKGEDIEDNLINKFIYYFDAINSSMYLEGNVDMLCFGGKNDEYKKIRECLLSHE